MVGRVVLWWITLETCTRVAMESGFGGNNSCWYGVDMLLPT